MNINFVIIITVLSLLSSSLFYAMQCVSMNLPTSFPALFPSPLPLPKGKSAGNEVVNLQFSSPIYEGLNGDVANTVHG